MSIIRPEKRDPNHIRNKSDIGLSKVDNISSAEFASIVLDQVKRHLNRETIYQTSGRRFIALAKITCKSDGSGNLVKILSGNLFLTFAVLNDSEDVREAAKLEAIYTHSTNGTEADSTDDAAKVEYNLFMTEDPALLNECYIEFRENVFENSEGNKINEMYVILRCDAANLPFVSINLFEYSNGGVALDPVILDDATLASYTLIDSAKCDHNRFSLVDRSESTIGFEIYDDNGNPIRVRETDDSINPIYDIPKINDVPFTGRRNVFVEGKNTRQIKISAKHSGPTNAEAGDHDWDVLTYAPRSGYTYYKDSDYDNKVLNDVIVPQTESFLDKDTFEVVENNLSTGYGYGLCRLSGCDTKLAGRMFDSEIDLFEKLKFAHDWVDTLSNNESDVIPVKVFKIFADSMMGLLSDVYKNTVTLKDIISKEASGITDTSKIVLNKIYPAFDDYNLGYRYIFDYARTSDSVTIVPYEGMENRTYDIKLGVIGSGDGSAGIDIDDKNNFIKGGNCSWVNIVGIDRRPNESASITFSFLPNTTDMVRYGYYIIPSTQPNIKLIYRFYQDVITSNLRIKYTDENQKSEYYAFDTVIRKSVKNTAEKYVFDNICIVDNTVLDEQGNPSKLDRMLDYEIVNAYETGGDIVTAEVIRNEANQVLGFEVAFSNNNTNVDRVVYIYIREAGARTRNILTFQITQSAREFEFTVPESLTLEGRVGNWETLPIEGVNKTWRLDIIKGSDFIELSDIRGEVGAGEDGKDFNVTVKALKNNISNTAKEIAILKLYAEGDESKYKRIFIYQNGSPALCSLQGRTVIIPYNKDGVKTEEFFCTYDWEIILSEELKKWCSVTEESGKECSEENPTSVIFTALETTQLTETREGTATIRYADGASTEFIVRQEAARFDFTLSGLADGNRVNLGDNTESDPAVVEVISNYGWNIGLEHTDSKNKRFTACIDRIEGKMDEGVSGSSIYVSVTKNSTSDSESVKLGKVKIYALGTVVEEFDVYQDKVGVSISLSPGTTAGWYPNGDSKQSGTNVTIPVIFTPATAALTATYSIDGDTPVAADITKSAETGKATITLPGIGANPKGKESRSISITAKAEVGSLSKTASCKITQAGYSNGIRVTKDGSSTEYYGGSRSTESTYYFGPVKQSKSFAPLYVPLGAKNLSVTVPNWLSYSKGTDSSADDYLLKIRETISNNETGSDRTGTITITSGSGNDMTTATISVVQRNGTWIFGDSNNSNYGNLYTLEKPYEMSLNATASSDATFTFTSSLTYGSKTELSSCTAQVIEGSDWCEASITSDPSTYKGTVVAKSKSTNSTSGTKTAIIKVTQSDTNRAFYVRVTQSVTRKLYMYGGVKGVKYVYVNSLVDSIALNSTQAQVVMNKATVINGAGGATAINNYTLDDISYVKYSNGNISTDYVKNLGSNETLYLMSVVYTNNSVSGLSENYSNYSSDFCSRISIVPGKVTLTAVHIYIQGFGANKISLSNKLDGQMILEGGYEYILSDSPHSIYWETASNNVLLSTDYWFYVSENVDLDINGNVPADAFFFTVNPTSGVGFFTNNSSTQIARSQEAITLYVYRRPHDYIATDPGNPNYKVWSGCGTVMWTPVDTNPTVLWYY